MVNIYYQNARGLRTKTVQFKRNIQLHSYDVVIITETWLLDGINNEELFSDKYAVWRRDRDYSSVGQERGGGVLIATRYDLVTHARPEWHSTAEDIWVSIDIGAKGKSPISLHIGCLYLCQQNLGLSFNTQLINFSERVVFASTKNPYDKFFIAGDFNLSNISWSSANGSNYLTPLVDSANSNHTELLDLINLCGLRQFNNVKNNMDRLLDLVISNEDVSVSHCKEPLVREDPYHPALICKLNFINLPALKSQPRPKYFYYKADYTALRADLDSQDWQTLLSCGSVDDAVAVFNNKLSSLRDKHVPFKLTHPSRYPVWYSPALIKILKEKKKIHTKLKTYGNLADRVSFNVLRQRAKKVEQECFDNYINSTENSIRENPKAFWSYVNSNKHHNSFPSSMNLENTTLTSGTSICDAFARFFRSNFLEVDPSSATQDLNCAQLESNLLDSPNISSIEIMQTQVEKMLETLDRNKSAGPDGLHPVLISNCSRSLASPVSLLFIRSLTDGVVPKIWKTATVTPIHKKGSKRDVANYRPISKLCVLAKVLEKIIHHQVYAALKQTFIPQQHGFLKGRSTVSNLLCFTDDLTSGMQSGGQVDSVYTDYTKAFDRIDHVILLRKLQSAGIHGDLLRWFASYISGRCQTVVLNGFSSHPHYSAIPSGVPQGSILGPLLFVIFINDIHKCFSHSNYLLFADDMKIYKKINSIEDCELLQQDLNRFHDYCISNKLDLNISKCICITFTRSPHPISFDYSINQQSLQRTDRIRDLGVILDAKLLFDKHVDHITSKAMKTLGFIIRVTKNFKMAKSLKILYCSLVRSQLEYASQVWNPQYNLYIDQIEKNQRKFLRFLNYKFRINTNHDYTVDCKHHHMLPLSLRREAADLTYLHNLVLGRHDSSELLSKIKFRVPFRANLRRNYLTLHVESPITNYRQNFFFNRVAIDFNKNFTAYVDLFTARPNYFKKHINSIFF